MARRSRDPNSSAVVHEMAPDAQAQYERVKRQRGGVVGWSRSYDPWAWSNATAKDNWAGSGDSNPGIWPPPPQADAS